MGDAALIALFALLTVIATTGASLLGVWLTARINRLAKAADYARQDAVAAQVSRAVNDAANAAQRATAQASEAARLLVVQNHATAKAAAVVSDKLDVIHTLVDGNMTAAMQSELDATIRELAMMGEVLRLHEAAGRAPTAEALAAIESTQRRIDDLRVKLTDRVSTESQIKDGRPSE